MSQVKGFQTVYRLPKSVDILEDALNYNDFCMSVLLEFNFVLHLNTNKEFWFLRMLYLSR